VTEHAIEVHGLSKHFGAFRAVDDVSFHVETGEIFGYLGANGAGKSTTIRMLCGLLGPTTGDATVAGHSVARDPLGVRRAIGYMSQKFSLYVDLTVEDNLSFFGGAYGLSGKRLRTRMDEVLALVDLRDARSSNTADLPGGIRQRVALANALLHAPQIVFLDEPTAGVDPASRRAFWRLIRRLANEGTTVFVTTHYMDEAEYCARIGLMVAGRLVALDTPSALKSLWVPGTMLAVHGTGLGPASRALEGVAGVHAVEPFGAGLHVRVGGELADGSSIARTLTGAGATDVSVVVTEASLEDVFLAAVATPEGPATGAAGGAA
jgi:ABC-2 type transport system ATP-binding protein